MLKNRYLLLDTANLKDIERLATTNAIAGVTTNPSLMAKEDKGDYTNKLKMIAQLLDNEERCLDKTHLSVEVVTLDPEEMISQGQRLHFDLEDYGLDVHIKVPVTIDNLRVITELRNFGIKVNATACMTAVQAKIAIDAGANIVSFFYNRMKDGGDPDPEGEISKINSMLWNSPDIKIICGSIRKPEDVLRCWSAGAHYVTAGINVIEKLLIHHETDKAIKGFQEDIEKWLS